MKKKIIKFSIQFFITAILIYIIIKFVYIQDVLNHLYNIKLLYFISSAILFLIACSINVLKWKYILCSNNRFINFFSLLKFYLYTFFYNLFLPGSNSSDLVRSMWLKKYINSYAVSLWSIFWERFSGMTAMALFSLTGIIIIENSIFPNNLRISIMLFSILIIILFFVLLLNSLYSIYLKKLILIFKSKFSNFKKACDFINNVISIKFHFKTAFFVLIISIFSQCLTVYYHYLLGLAIGVDASFYIYLIVVPLISFVKIIPWTINSIGVRETTFMYLFAFFGIANSESVSIGLLAFAIQVFAGIFMGIVHIFDKEILIVKNKK
jgi:glycosyltransferase 2 family protein